MHWSLATPYMDSMYLPTQGAVGILRLLASLVGQLYFMKEKYSRPVRLALLATSVNRPTHFNWWVCSHPSPRAGMTAPVFRVTFSWAWGRRDHVTRCQSLSVQLPTWLMDDLVQKNLIPVNVVFQWHGCCICSVNLPLSSYVVKYGPDQRLQISLNVQASCDDGYGSRLEPHPLLRFYFNEMQFWSEIMAFSIQVSHGK